MQLIGVIHLSNIRLEMLLLHFVELSFVGAYCEWVQALWQQHLLVSAVVLFPSMTS